MMFSFTLSNCEQKTELSDLEFEKNVFYELFPELSDKMYNDIRLIPTPPPPSPKYLTEKGFDAQNDYNKALENWEKSDDYQNRLNEWKVRRDSIINDTTLIYIAFSDSISRFEREDMYELINHFNDQKLVIDSKDFELIGGFKVDFDKLKSDNEKLRFKPISEFPERREFWRTKYDFNFQGSLSFTRILFDKTKTFGVLNAGFVKGRLNGSGCRIFIRKDENGNWEVDKIIGTWVS
ncbi:hypothetical protein [Winogradskyella sp.]|uniref:hypothetical protein n=1 Tax=Winogradskyella sp. TaxID=1883156 RepID=UPI002621E39F|nr:hypothetical protein [Winogradskyella sp.]